MEPQSISKKGIINLQIAYNSQEDLDALATSEQFTSFILQNSLDIITQAMEEKKDKVELFNIVNMSFIVEIEKSQYPSILKKIMEYYADQEDYDKCIEIQNVLNSII
jgi:hypothetical protein